MEQWLAENWFPVVSTVGIAGSLWFTAIAFYMSAKTQQIANLLTITKNHREIWTQYLSSEKLARVRDRAADTAQQPLAEAELVFVTLVILHTNSVYYAMNEQLVVNYEGGLNQDIADFFSRPIPKLVWEKTKRFQNADFVQFIETILK